MSDNQENNEANAKLESVLDEKEKSEGEKTHARLHGAVRSLIDAFRENKYCVLATIVSAALCICIPCLVIAGRFSYFVVTSPNEDVASMLKTIFQSNVPSLFASVPVVFLGIVAVRRSK